MKLENRFVPDGRVEKPPRLFHASRDRHLSEVSPRAEKIRDDREGARVFATPDRAIVSMFLVESDDSWVKSGAINGQPYIVISDEQRFRNADQGGAIYALPGGTFESDPQKGLGELEWTSSTSVKPIGKEVVPSALEDMLAHGVRVYFVDKEAWARIEDSGDIGAVLKTLMPIGSDGRT